MTSVRLTAVLIVAGTLLGCTGPRQSKSLTTAGALVGPTARDGRDMGTPLRLVTHTESRDVSGQTPVMVPLPSVTEESELPSALSLADLEGMALASNPSLAAASARVDAAHGRWLQAGLPPNPVLGYAGQQLSSHGQSEQQGVFVGQVWVRGGKLALNQAIACHEIEVAEQALSAQRQRVLTDVRLAFAATLLEQARVKLARSGDGIAGEALATIERQRTAMEVGDIELARARIDRQRAQLALARALSQEESAWQHLEVVVGAGPLPTRRLTGSLATAEQFSPGMTEFDLDSTLARIVAGSPEVAAALTRVQQARVRIERAHAEPVPDIDIQTIVQSDNGTGSSNFNLQVTAPIPWWDRNQGGIQAAHAQLVAAEHSEAALEMRLRAQLANVLKRYDQAQSQVSQYQSPDGILETWKEAEELTRRAYEAGEIGYLELVAVQQERASAMLASLEARGELVAAAIEIDGLLLKDSMAPTFAASGTPLP